MGVKYIGRCEMCRKHGYLRNLELCFKCNLDDYTRQKRITALLWGRWWQRCQYRFREVIALIY